jgi:hypothetical protein
MFIDESFPFEMKRGFERMKREKEKTINLKKSFFVAEKSSQAIPHLLHTSGLYYKTFTIVIYNRNDSGQYYNTRITVVIDDTSLSLYRQL